MRVELVIYMYVPDSVCVDNENSSLYDKRVNLLNNYSHSIPIVCYNSRGNELLLLYEVGASVICYATLNIKDMNSYMYMIDRSLVSL